MKPLFRQSRLPFGVSLALLVLSLSAGLARAEAATPDCYVISAGVDNYPNANKLKGCLNDARNTTAAFRNQEGHLFGKVQAQTLLDRTATRQSILRRFQNVSRQGKAGDYVVLFLSGHGGRTNGNRTWYFLPYDYNAGNAGATTLTDRQILDAADVLVKQGKKVFVIIDACFSGQLRATAQEYFRNYRSAKGGGLVLLLSSRADQTSAALGQFSAFAKAFADGMTGKADFNRDGTVTLQEIQEYSYQRTHQLIRERNMKDKQDSEVAWSPSVSGQLALARTRQVVARRPDSPRPSSPKRRDQGVTVYTGKETLAGYGNLIFRLYPDNRAVMVDAKETSEGEWERTGQRITLRFSDGRVVYAGVLNGSTLSGTANNGRATWRWAVRTQAVSNN